MFDLRYIIQRTSNANGFLMANGYHGPPDGWERIEAPLRELDDSIFAFASQHGFMVRKSDHNWPSRTIVWKSDGLDRLIQVFLEDQKDLTYTLWICAKKDQKDERLLKALSLREGVLMDSLKTELVELLDAGHRLLSSWSMDDLEISVTLPKHSDID